MVRPRAVYYTPGECRARISAKNTNEKGRTSSPLKLPPFQQQIRNRGRVCRKRKQSSAFNKKKKKSGENAARTNNLKWLGIFSRAGDRVAVCQGKCAELPVGEKRHGKTLACNVREPSLAENEALSRYCGFGSQMSLK